MRSVTVASALALAACTGGSAAPASIVDTGPPEFEALPAVTAPPITPTTTTRPPSTTMPRSTTTLRTEPLGDALADFTFGTPRTVTYRGLPMTDGRLSPDGTQLVFSQRDELCMLDLSDTPESEQGETACTPTGGSVFQASMAWAPDGTRVLFHHDPFATAVEPDIMALDVASMTVERLTDDGVADTNPDAGLFDVAPFHTPDGRAFFLRMARENGELVTQVHEVLNGTATRIDSASIVGLPARVVVDPATGLAVFEMQLSAVLRTGLGIVNPITGDTARLPDPENDRGYFRVVAVAGTYVLATSLSSQSRTTDDIVLVDLTDGSIDVVSPPILGTRQDLTGLALAPDGNSLLLIVEDRSDADGSMLVTAPVLDDGTIGDFGIVAQGPDFAPNDGDVTVQPAGLDRNGRAGTIGWRSDRLVYALGPDRIVVLPIEE